MHTVISYLTGTAPGLILSGALVLFGTLRLTRFIVSDSLGEWLLKPVKDWAKTAEKSHRVVRAQTIAKSADWALDSKNLDKETRQNILTRLQEKLDELEYDEDPQSCQAKLVRIFCRGGR